MWVVELRHRSDDGKNLDETKDDDDVEDDGEDMNG